jgi:hypothetical protein
MKIYLPQHRLWVLRVALNKGGPGWCVRMGDRICATSYATPVDARVTTNALTWLGFKWEFDSEST